MTAQVAFIIPTFNDDAVHLREAVNSALEQDGVSVDVVVVNDGSTRPETLRALDALPPMVFRIDQANGGPAAARNAGLRLTSCPFVVPLDGDDRVSRDFAARGVEALESDAECQFAYGRVVLFGAETGVKIPPPSVGLADLVGGNRIAATAVYRRKDWEAVAGYDEELRRGFEDYEYWIRLLTRLGGHGTRTEATLEYRQRSDSRRRSDLSTGMAVTRERILVNNSAHLDILLRATWNRLDESSAETQMAWNDPLQIRRYLRPLKALLAKSPRKRSRSPRMPPGSTVWFDSRPLGRL